MPSKLRPLVAFGLCVVGLWTAAPVGAAELPYPLSQAVADDGQWLPFDPPLATPGGICMIDSGVDLNPDIQPAVVARIALDGGDPGDVSPMKHGTLMAMVASAAVNDWGMIGAAPAAVRIVSVRVESNIDTLTFGAYKQGILACQELATRHPEWHLLVVSMSVGFQGAPPLAQLAELQDAALAARDSGLDVIAAVGDEMSQSPSYPAAASPILAVGASGADNNRCWFSNLGAAVLAPGCDLQEADPITGMPSGEFEGSSQSDAIVAAVLAALRSYRPDLGPGQAEQLLINTAQAAGSLDVGRLFRAANLDSVIAAGQRNAPPPTPLSAPSQLASSPKVRHPVRLSQPKVSIRQRGTMLWVHLLNIPAHGQALLSILTPRGRAFHSLVAATRRRVLRFKVTAHSLLKVVYVPRGTYKAAKSLPLVIPT